VQISGKRNDFCSSIENHSADPAFAHGAGHRLQTTHVVSPQRSASSYFHTDQSPGIVFQNDVHFLTTSGAPIIKLRLNLAPGRLFS